jgi:hypothetical protein
MHNSDQESSGQAGQGGQHGEDKEDKSAKHVDKQQLVDKIIQQNQLFLDAAVGGTALLERLMDMDDDDQNMVHLAEAPLAPEPAAYSPGATPEMVAARIKYVQYLCDLKEKGKKAAELEAVRLMSKAKGKLAQAKDAKRSKLEEDHAQKQPWHQEADEEPKHSPKRQHEKEDWSSLRKCNKCQWKTYIKKNTCANPACELNPLKAKLREMETYINQMWAGHEQVLVWMQQQEEHDACLRSEVQAQPSAGGDDVKDPSHDADSTA